MKLVAHQIGYAYSTRAKPVLSHLSFTAESGSYWCLAGPNGSGKSTFLKVACGLITEPGFSGALSWDKRPLAQWDRRDMARDIAFVPGSIKAQFAVPVRDFLIQGRYARSEKAWAPHTSDDYRIADACAERIGIVSLLKSNLTEISAGETQLAMIARALAQEPKVLVLDETTANLDIGYQARIFGVLSELNAQGLTILVVSHDLNLAAEFCPNAVWLNDGTVYAQGTMEETLTDQLMKDLYGVEGKVEVGRNPFTKRPKIFWRD